MMRGRRVQEPRGLMLWSSCCQTRDKTMLVIWWLLFISTMSRCFVRRYPGSSQVELMSKYVKTINHWTHDQTLLYNLQINILLIFIASFQDVDFMANSLMFLWSRFNKSIYTFHFFTSSSSSSISVLSFSMTEHILGNFAGICRLVWSLVFFWLIE